MLEVGTTQSSVLYRQWPKRLVKRDIGVPSTPVKTFSIALTTPIAIFSSFLPPSNSISDISAQMESLENSCELQQLRCGNVAQNATMRRAASMFKMGACGQRENNSDISTSLPALNSELKKGRGKQDNNLAGVFAGFQEPPESDNTLNNNEKAADEQLISDVRHNKELQEFKRINEIKLQPSPFPAVRGSSVLRKPKISIPSIEELENYITDPATAIGSKSTAVAQPNPHPNSLGLSLSGPIGYDINSQWLALQAYTQNFVYNVSNEMMRNPMYQSIVPPAFPPSIVPPSIVPPSIVPPSIVPPVPAFNYMEGAAKPVLSIVSRRPTVSSKRIPKTTYRKV